jgi:2,3-bisphosphoglycerate-independent phosphoglycerate mutase
MIDACLAKVAAAVETVESRAPDGPGAVLVVTADHGNADEMRDATGSPVTAHSLNPVPVLALGRAVRGRRLRDGVLADVAPTLLELARLPSLPGMTGTSLLER